MDVFDDLMLGYALKKLTCVFEKVVMVADSIAAVESSGLIGDRQGKDAKRLSVWLGCLKANAPYQVTHILIDQMHAARKLNQASRLEAQIALLDALVEAGVAMHIASYSVALVEKRLKCFC
ncbi:hypothetical protein BJ917_1563 [Pseudomonas sp. WPR_5_2]|uniref:hypothetical protein n=1 Tax=Pseudomonas sp. WPR_5_2 TaxID=1907371 RepID=UPI000EB2813E|nr:hypothetical protein [Pseudomonas sp. WPR_5_2]RKS28665.1 hypothetical protein BJ917_1563 [Pseudomonas sp. WPR_5_2]